MSKSKTKTDRFTIHRKACSWKDGEGRVNPGEHGTTGQYARALRVGAVPCSACRKANVEKDKAWRRANPGKKSGRGKGAEVIDHTARLAEKAKAERKQGPQSRGTGKGRKAS